MALTLEERWSRAWIAGDYAAAELLALAIDNALDAEYWQRRAEEAENRVYILEAQLQ